MCWPSRGKEMIKMLALYLLGFMKLTFLFGFFGFKMTSYVPVGHIFTVIITLSECRGRAQCLREEELANIVK
mgnify:CR=1 FL=1